MQKYQVREIVLELLEELIEGTVRNEPKQDADGDEHNNYAFDGDLFVQRVYAAIEKQSETAN